VELAFHPPHDGEDFARRLLADTGAGSLDSSWDLVLSTEDCRRLQLSEGWAVQLGGALVGAFPSYFIEAAVPQLGGKRLVVAVGVPVALLPPALEGIAGFRFLNRFTYGNFGDPARFCVETNGTPPNDPTAPSAR